MISPLINLNEIAEQAGFFFSKGIFPKISNIWNIKNPSMELGVTIFSLEKWNDFVYAYPQIPASTGIL